MSGFKIILANATSHSGLLSIPDSHGCRIKSFFISFIIQSTKEKKNIIDESERKMSETTNK
jgi:hypothetical protein